MTENLNLGFGRVTSVGRGGRMTTVWRPDLKRIRAEIAAEAKL